MTYQDAVSDLVRLWDRLPLLVGSPWGELEQPLRDALEQLAAAETDDDRDQRIGDILRLCLPYSPLRRALEPAIRREDNRSGQSEPVTWPEITGQITTTIERPSRPGGDQWLVANLVNHAADEPLRAGRSYDLTIGVVGDGPPAGALAAEPLPPPAGPGQDPADSMTLTVQVRGDAGIEAVKPVLTLPRHGASPDVARFRVTPRAGAEWLTLTAVITRDGMFIQVLTLTARISDEVAVRSRASGRPLAEAFASVHPAAILLIQDSELLLLIGPDKAEASLPYSQQELELIAEGPRNALQEIAHGVQENGRAAHQASLTIPPQVYETSLAALVEAGTLMFGTLFHGPRATRELRDLGGMLEGIPWHDGPLWLEVVAETHVIPWHLLAFPGPEDPAADPSRVLGLRHRVTYLTTPRRRQHPPPARSLRADGSPLRVVLAVNQDIDEYDGTERDLVKSQLAAWRQRADGAGDALAVTVTPGPDVLDVLVRSMPPAELLYFFCHAYLDQNPGRLDPMAACLELTGGHKVSLKDLIRSWRADYEFDAAPLVVLNACDSAGPASSVYGSFLPYLLARGARGVIGTEADVPPVFAAAWAQEFFSRLLDGEPLADAAFGVTRDLADRHKNLLGLVYTLHCDGRNLVEPAIPREPPAPAARRS